MSTGHRHAGVATPEGCWQSLFGKPKDQQEDKQVYQSCKFMNVCVNLQTSIKQLCNS